MANDLNNLLDRVERVDRSLAAELRTQISTRPPAQFGLNLRSTSRDRRAVRLTVRAGDKVRLSPPRSERPHEDARTWRVRPSPRPRPGTRSTCWISTATSSGTHRWTSSRSSPTSATILRAASRSRAPRRQPHRHQRKLPRARSHVFTSQAPSTRSISTALQHRQDWKYNNDYVDGEDAYRHSKWLSFMERRLARAQAAQPQRPVPIVTIDEGVPPFRAPPRADIS